MHAYTFLQQDLTRLTDGCVFNRRSGGLRGAQPLPRAQRALYMRGGARVRRALQRRAPQQRALRTTHHSNPPLSAAPRRTLPPLTHPHAPPWFFPLCEPIVRLSLGRSRCVDSIKQSWIKTASLYWLGCVERVRCTSHPFRACPPPLHTHTDTLCRRCMGEAETLEHVIFHSAHNSLRSAAHFSPLFAVTLSAAEGSDAVPILQQRAFFAQTSQHRLTCCFSPHLR